MKTYQVSGQSAGLYGGNSFPGVTIQGENMHDALNRAKIQIGGLFGDTTITKEGNRFYTTEGSWLGGRGTVYIWTEGRKKETVKYSQHTKFTTEDGIIVNILHQKWGQWEWEIRITNSPYNSHVISGIAPNERVMRARIQTAILFVREKFGLSYKDQTLISPQ